MDWAKSKASVMSKSMLRHKNAIDWRFFKSIFKREKMGVGKVKTLPIVSLETVKKKQIESKMQIELLTAKL